MHNTIFVLISGIFLVIECQFQTLNQDGSLRKRIIRPFLVVKKFLLLDYSVQIWTFTSLGCSVLNYKTIIVSSLGNVFQKNDNASQLIF